VPTGTWLAWSQVNDIAGRVAQEWTPAGTALSDGPSAAKVAEVKAYDTGDAVGYDRAYTYDGAQRLTNGDRSPIGFWDGDETRVNDPVGRSADRRPLERVTVRQGIESRLGAPVLPCGGPNPCHRYRGFGASVLDSTTGQAGTGTRVELNPAGGCRCGALARRL
jgi:hypothetical protein